MMVYKVFVTENAKKDLKFYSNYLLNIKKNSQAAKSLMMDFKDTRIKLQTVAGALKNPDNEKLNERGLKRINFLRHDYFLLFTIRDDKVFITNIFHFLEDFENKLV